MHRWSILIIFQRDAKQISLFIILHVHYTYFGCQPRQAWPRWREVAAQKIWLVPEIVVTVLCTPDDGCGWHPKHVEWTCRIINRLLCVASRWTIINIVLIFIYLVTYLVSLSLAQKIRCQIKGSLANTESEKMWKKKPVAWTESNIPTLPGGCEKIAKKL